MSAQPNLPTLSSEELADLPDEVLHQRIESGHKKVEKIKKQVGKLMLEGLVAAGQTGAALNETKNRIEYGSWTDWLSENFPASHRTAQNYMRIADNWEWVREEAKRVSEPLSYRRAIQRLQSRDRHAMYEQSRQKVVSHAKRRIQEAVESERITEEQASTVRTELLPHAERVVSGQLKPSTFRRRLTNRLDRVQRENLPEPERRSFEAGTRFEEAYEAGDRFRARLQDLRDEGDRAWLGTMAALRLATVLVQIQQAASALMADIQEAASDDQEVPTEPDPIEVGAREEHAQPAEITEILALYESVADPFSAESSGS